MNGWAFQIYSAHLNQQDSFRFLKKRADEARYSVESQLDYDESLECGGVTTRVLQQSSLVYADWNLFDVWFATGLPNAYLIQLHRLEGLRTAKEHPDHVGLGHMRHCVDIEVNHWLDSAKEKAETGRKNIRVAPLTFGSKKKQQQGNSKKHSKPIDYDEWWWNAVAWPTGWLHCHSGLSAIMTGSCIGNFSKMPFSDWEIANCKKNVCVPQFQMCPWQNRALK